MKIMLVSPPWIDTPPIDYGGTELVISVLCEELVGMGHEVTLFATKSSKTSGKLDFVFEQSLLTQNIGWTNALPSMIHYHQAFKRAERENFDVIHAHLSSQTDLLILPLLESIKIPSLVTIHGLWPFDGITGMDKYFVQYYVNKISFVHISRTMLSIQPKVLNPLGYVYNGIDINKYNFNPTPKGYLTWLGKIVKDKGTAIAIKASILAGEVFIFAGKVEEYSEESKRYFEEEIKPFINGNNVIYLGVADLKLKNEMLSNAKAFLNPICWEEPFGMVMIESMATGTPVISYERGAAKEIIVDGKNGFLIEENVESMVNAIKKIDKINREDCRRHIEENFHSKVMAEGYLTMYEKTISKRKKKINPN